MKLHALFLFFITISIVGCQNEKSSQKQIEEQTTVVEKSKIKTVAVTEMSGCEDDNLPCVDIKIEYPALNNYAKGDKESIHYYIRGYLTDFLVADESVNTKELESFVQKSINVIKQKQDDYKLHVAFTPLLENSQLLSLQAEYLFQENNVEEIGIGYGLFDLRASDIVDHHQIVKDDTGLAKLLVATIKKRENLQPNQDISLAGYDLSDAEFIVTDNIGVSKDKMFFAYSPAEIATAEKGLIFIELTKAEVSPYLTGAFIEKWNAESK